MHLSSKAVLKCLYDGGTLLVRPDSLGVIQHPTIQGTVRNQTFQTLLQRKRFHKIGEHGDGEVYGIKKMRMGVSLSEPISIGEDEFMALSARLSHKDRVAFFLVFGGFNLSFHSIHHYLGSAWVGEDKNVRTKTNVLQGL